MEDNKEKSQEEMVKEAVEEAKKTAEATNEQKRGSRRDRSKRSRDTRPAKNPIQKRRNPARSYLARRIRKIKKTRRLRN